MGLYKFLNIYLGSKANFYSCSWELNAKIKILYLEELKKKKRKCNNGIYCSLCISLFSRCFTTANFPVITAGFKCLNSAIWPHSCWSEKGQSRGMDPSVLMDFMGGWRVSWEMLAFSGAFSLHRFFAHQQLTCLSLGLHCALMPITTSCISKLLRTLLLWLVH